MDINIYDLKLKEIDREISLYKETPRHKAFLDCQNRTGSSIFFGGSIFASSGGFQCDELKRNNPLVGLENKRKTLVLEMGKEQQHLKDQYMLQQAEATEFARQQALKAAEEVRKATEEVKAAANKTEQELQDAKKKLAQANQELAKQRGLEAIAQSVEAGDKESSRILMGINTVSKYKTPLIIGAVTLTVLALGFVGYKMLAKAKKV